MSQTRSTGHASSRLSSGRIKDQTRETAEIEPIIYLDSFMKNIFNTYAFKRLCVVLAPSLPHPTVFFASV